MTVIEIARFIEHRIVSIDGIPYHLFPGVDAYEAAEGDTFESIDGRSFEVQDGQWVEITEGEI